jgi:hypothetical protein
VLSDAALPVGTGATPVPEHTAPVGGTVRNPAHGGLAGCAFLVASDGTGRVAAGGNGGDVEAGGGGGDARDEGGDDEGMCEQLHDYYYLR